MIGSNPRSSPSRYHALTTTCPAAAHCRSEGSRNHGSKNGFGSHACATKSSHSARKAGSAMSLRVSRRNSPSRGGAEMPLGGGIRNSLARAMSIAVNPVCARQSALWAGICHKAINKASALQGAVRCGDKGKAKINPAGIAPGGVCILLRFPAKAGISSGASATPNEASAFAGVHSLGHDQPAASAASSSSATILVILIIGLTAGPAVSL